MSAVAAVVLAGGRSTRMGRPKATLDWHGSTLLRRAAGIVGRAVDGPVVVVRAAGQELPVAHGFPHPLAAAYRTRVTAHIDDLLEHDVLGTRALFERCRVRRLDEA